MPSTLKTFTYIFQIFHSTGDTYFEMCKYKSYTFIHFFNQLDSTCLKQSFYSTPQSFPIVSPIYSTSETLLVLSVPQSLHCSTEHVLFILWTLLYCKHFEHDPQLYNTPSPIILLLMYTWLIYSKNNFIANRLNVHLLCSRLIPCSSVSLNSHRTSL